MSDLDWIRAGIADSNIYKSFNDFFARHLVSADKRPIASSSVVSPADSVPQGVWRIDDSGKIIQKDGVIIKSKRVVNVNDLFARDSKYFDAFNGGTFTHTFLDVNDYHRYHFPVSGKIVELKKIPALDAIGGITIWDKKAQRYMLEANVPGWQMVQTRDSVIVDTKEFGLVAIFPIAMSQVSSCNFEANLKVGQEVKKGDPMGYFLFGGSDIIMLFQKGIKTEYLPKENNAFAYGRSVYEFE